MPVYDCRKDDRAPGALNFPCNVRILDPATGERLTNVFFASTAPAELGRFVLGPDGEPMVDAKTRRKVWDTDANGRKCVRIVWDRLERWERRPWVAVAVDTGQVVAKSEGV